MRTKVRGKALEGRGKGREMSGKDVKKRHEREER